MLSWHGVSLVSPLKPPLDPWIPLPAPPRRSVPHHRGMARPLQFLDYLSRREDRDYVILADRGAATAGLRWLEATAAISALLPGSTAIAPTPMGMPSVAVIPCGISQRLG